MCCFCDQYGKQLGVFFANKRFLWLWDKDRRVPDDINLRCSVWTSRGTSGLPGAVYDVRLKFNVLFVD